MERHAFVKYHGTGNDFIVLDNRRGAWALTGQEIAALCDRHRGIGADGLMELLGSDRYDFIMKYYNADGREGTMCGNGGRCISAFAADLGIVGESARFLAIDGEHRARIGVAEGGTRTVSVSLNDVAGMQDGGTGAFILDTGSPHFVRFVTSFEGIDVRTEGRSIRWEKRFQPAGINVNFVRASGPQLEVRTFERGVEDVTLSCGTGVTAAAVAAAANSADGEYTWEILTAGGDLSVAFRKEKGTCRDIWLKGPATRVFEGVIER